MKMIVMPQYMDDKNSLLYVSTDEGKIHQSWLLQDDRVICYEHIPENYPSGILCTWDSFDDYVTAISDIWWINEEDYILHFSDELADIGFPFQDEEEEDWEHGTNHPLYEN